MRRIARAALRPWPAAPVLSAIERAAPRYARLALRARGAGLPRNVRAFPARVAPYFGTEPGPAEHARLVEARLVFLLIRAFVQPVPARARGRRGTARGSVPSSFAARPISRRRVAEQRGLLLISAHFGLPSLIRLALRERGLPVVGVGGLRAERVDVVVGRDVWAAARGTQQVRDALADGASVRASGRYAEGTLCGAAVPAGADPGGGRGFPARPDHPKPAAAGLRGPCRRAVLGSAWRSGRRSSVPDRSSASPFAESLGTGSVRCFEAIARSVIRPSSSATSRYSALSRWAARPRPGAAPGHAPEVLVRDAPARRRSRRGRSSRAATTSMRPSESRPSPPSASGVSSVISPAKSGARSSERADQPGSPGGGVEPQRIARRGLSGHSTAPRGRGGALPASSPCRCW